MAFNPKFAELLGSKLLKRGDAPKEFVEVDTVEALQNTRAIALYFSAHWCPPCRGFTPKLAEWYLTSLKALGLEVVFLSSDRDEDSFRDYFAEMPWLALPFSEREMKAKLGKKFDCEGIPYLVILGADGTIISKKGRERVSEDPTGEKFPWREEPLSAIIGDTFEKKGETLTMSDLKGKTLGLYFSAHWCPPCKMFTPVLAEAYKKVRGQGKDFEVIFVSSDRDEASFKEYYDTMPWACLPYSDRARAKALSNHFGVSGIPALVMLDESLNVISDSAAGVVRGDESCELFPWRAPIFSDIDDSCDGINERAALVVVVQEGADDAVREASLGILKALAEEQEAMVAAKKAKAEGQPKTCFDEEEEPFCFFSAVQADGRLRGRVVSDCKLKSNGDGVQVVLLAIHEEGAYYEWPADAAFTREGVEEFLKAYRHGKLTRKQMGESSP